MTKSQELPVAYISKAFSKSERNYSVSEKELYAIVASMEHFKHYLYGKKFTVYSEHKPLSWLLTCEKPSQQLARWLIRIERLNFEIVYREGPKNGNVDGFSRMPADVKDNPDQRNGQEEANGDYIICNLSVDDSINLFDDQLKQQQLADSDIKWIYEHVKNHGQNKPEFNSFDTLNQQVFFSVNDSFLIQDDHLYRETKDEHDRTLKQFILPKSQVTSVLQTLQESKFCGHLGIEKTWQRVQQRFYFPNMKARTRKFVKECVKCQKIKVS